MSLVTAPVVTSSDFFSKNLLYLSKKISWTQLEGLSILNFHLSDKIGKIDTK